ASHNGVSIACCETNSPAVNNNESPGRKNPTSSPHSAKMIRQAPSSMYGPSADRIVSAWSQSGSSASEEVGGATTLPRVQVRASEQTQQPDDRSRREP